MKDTNATTRQVLIIVRNLFIAGFVAIIAVALIQSAMAAESNVFADYVKASIFPLAEGLLFGLAALMAGVAGVQYMVSGSGEGTKEAKDTLMYAITGLLFYYLGCLFIPTCVSNLGVLNNILSTLRP